MVGSGGGGGGGGGGDAGQPLQAAAWMKSELAEFYITNTLC